MPVAFYLVDYTPKDSTTAIKDILYEPNYISTNLTQLKVDTFLPLYAERVTPRVNSTAWEGNVWSKS